MTPEQMRDASLLELFSLEAEAQTQVLSAGLMALERNPTQADQLEACMRAACSPPWTAAHGCSSSCSSTLR